MPRDLNRVDKRAIEALSLAPLIDALAERIGRADALALLQQINEKEAYERGLTVVQTGRDNDIPALVREVDTWGDGGRWAIDVLEQTDKTYFFNVTACPYHDKYLELGLKELGVCMSCCRDEPYARGFNPGLRLNRTQTIMEGAAYCDFRYRLIDG